MTSITHMANSIHLIICILILIRYIETLSLLCFSFGAEYNNHNGSDYHKDAAQPEPINQRFYEYSEVNDSVAAIYGS